MARCKSKNDLEIHHIRRDGGNEINNAQVLCKNCHVATTTYGTQGKTPPKFTEKVKSEALARAKNQCECTSNRDCH